MKWAFIEDYIVCKFYLSNVESWREQIDEVMMNLKQNDYCNLCKYVERITGGYTDCSVGREGWRDCQNYTIDWNAVAKEYLEKE